MTGRVAGVIHLELGLSQTLTAELDCIVSLADQYSARARDSLFQCNFFPLKYLLLTPFDLNVPNLVAAMERGMSCRIFSGNSCAGHDGRVLEER